MTKYEYKIIPVPSYDVEKKLNQIGKEGWELITEMRGYDGITRWTLKRKEKYD